MAGLLAVVLVMIGLPAPAGAAPGDLTTTVTWVEANTSTPVDELRGTENSKNGLNIRAGLAIGYACGPATCEGTTIRVDPMPVDPYYGAYRFATLDGQSLPEGATIGGSAAAGYTITLGTVAAGASGAFQLLYRYQSRPVGPSPQSFFPDGFAVTATSTISATGIEATSASDSVTWRIDTPEPSVAFIGSPAARADQDYTYRLAMGSGCLWARSTAGHGEPMMECAASYTATYTLPEGAEFVSASDGGTFDATTSSVTWSASGRDAATGWGTSSGGGVQDRTVTVQFPASLVTDPTQCVIQATGELAVDVVYLSGAAGAASTSMTHDVNACEAFAAATLLKTSTRTMGTVDDPIVWTGTNSEYWDIRVGNRSNVPAVATITDDALDIDGLEISRIRLTDPGDLTYTLDDGTTETLIGITAYNAPAGRYVTSATVVSSPIPGPNLMESDQPLINYFHARFVYRTNLEAPEGGYTGTNTASAVMTFPGTPELDPLDLGSSSQSVTVIDRPATLSPRLAREVAGSGNPLPGTPVTFTSWGITANQEPDVSYEPQYVFVAPENWAITPGSAAIEGVTDATFEYRTVVIDGVERQSVFATRPPGTVWGINTTWPVLSVVASPTASAVAGVSARASFYMGDAQHNYGRTDAIWGATGGTTFGSFRYVDAADLDGDNDLTEGFAWTYVDTVNGSASALSVLKEICLPDAGAADGCLWISDPANPVQVDPDATDISYRITISNDGNAPLNDVVAYDVLPHIGDVGTSASTATVPRGSTLNEALSDAALVEGDVTLTYSESTNPCRSEVYPGQPAGCDPAWAAAVTPNAVAIRADAGTLGVGESVSFTYAARIVGAVEAGDLACNSVAVTSTTTPTNEPAAVCALIAQADLAVDIAALSDWQQDRPRSVTITASNVAGSPQAPARLAVEVPAGVTLRSLPISPDATCTTGGTAPIEGPVTLDCVVADGLSPDAPITLALDVVPQVESEICFSAAITGDYADPELANNVSEACVTPATAYTVPGLTKSDGVSTIAVGSQTTYTVEVSNPLVGETLTDVTVTDTLPAGATFVSATADGVESDGVVTWLLSELPAASSTTFEVTILAPPTGATQLTNTVTATADDPAFPGTTLTNTATDVDDLAAIALTKAVVIDGEDAPRAGDIATFQFTITNTGTAELTGVEIDDQMTGLGPIGYSWADADGVLPTGTTVVASAEYRLTQADIDTGLITNTATASGTGADDAAASATNDAQLSLAAAPAIVVAKSATGEAGAAGDEVAFVIQVTNAGNVTLEDVTVLDELDGLSDLAYTWPGDEGTLAPGEYVQASATYAVTQEDVENGSVLNEASATATGVRGGDVAGDDMVTVPVIGTPALELRKTHDGDVSAAGDEVSYRFEIENTGNLTLTGVTLVDELAGMSAPVVLWPGAEGVLAPGEVATATADYRVSQADVDRGEVLNSAGVTGLSIQGEAVAQATDTLDITERAAVELTKSVDATSAAAGDVLTYTFTITNGGNVTLDGSAITDPLAGLSTVRYSWPGADGVLAPGQSATATATYVVTIEAAGAGSLTNTATVAATTLQGTAVSAEAAANVALEVPADPPPPVGAGGDAEEMPTTGTAPGTAIAVALVLAALGALLLSGARRRRSELTS